MSERRTEPRTRRPRSRVGEGGRRLHSAGSAVVVSPLALLVACSSTPRGCTSPRRSSPRVGSATRARRHRAARVGERRAPPRPAAARAEGGARALGRRRDRHRRRRSRSRRRARAGASPTPPPPRDVLAAATAPALDRRRLARRRPRPVDPACRRRQPGDRADRRRRRTHRERARAARRLQLVRARPGGDAEGQAARGRRHVRRKRRPRVHDGPPGGKGGRRASASASWTAEYRRRVAAIMDTVTRAGAFLVWIGLPITRRRRADGALRRDQRDRPDARPRSGRAACPTSTRTSSSQARTAATRSSCATARARS